MKINSISEANKVLGAYVPLTKTITGKDITLDRMRPLLALVGNPHLRLKAVHIAGTSGKTSTAYYIASLLRQSGKKIGLTTSPHIDSVAERVQINCKPLSEEVFCNYLGEFMDLIQPVQPTYFELLVAFAFWVFDKEQVDYSVVEVGMGGLHDGTNVLSSADKVCVITDIGLDHTHILGNTIPEIAAQKAGIIYEHNAVFCIEQSKEVMGVIYGHAQAKHALLEVLTLDGEKLPNELPLFQQRNWFLAKNTVEYVLSRDDLPALTEAQQEASLATYIPGRMEIVKYNGKTVIMDGAHNPQKMTAFVGSLADKFPGQKFSILIGMLSGKDLEETLKVIVPIAAGITATSFKAEQDMPRGSIASSEVADAARQLNIPNVKIIDGPEEAFRKIVQESNEPVLVTGSFFLLNYIRPLMVKA